MSIFFVQIIIGKKKSKQNCLKRNKPYSLIKTTWTQCGYFLIFIHELLLLKDSWDYFFCFWIVDLLSFNLNIICSFLHLILSRKLKTNIRHHQSQKTAIHHFDYHYFPYHFSVSLSHHFPWLFPHFAKEKYIWNYYHKKIKSNKLTIKLN